MPADPLCNSGAIVRDLRSLSDDDLLRRLSELLRQSRRVEADLVAHIGEVEDRRLYAREAATSMYTYCTDRLPLSEHEAYLRIAVARAAREHPVLLTMLADGRLHLSGIAKLLPHLTPANREALLERATHKSKRQIEELIAELDPRPDAPSRIRKLPERHATPTPAAPSSGTTSNGLAVLAGELGPDRVAAALPTGVLRPALVQPIAPARYKVQFTASAELCEKLERLKDLMRSSVPDGDLAALVDAAVTEKLQRLEAKRFAKTTRPDEAGRRGRQVTGVAPRACTRAPRRRRARRPSVPLRRHCASPVWSTHRVAIPPCPSPCVRWGPFGREHPADVPHPQPLPG